MFNYSLKTKIFLIMAFVFLLVFLLIITTEEKRRADDLLLVAQAKQLAFGLERYYDKFNVYPDLTRSSAVSIGSISDKGVNVAGEQKYYFVRDFAWVGSATIISRADNYLIEFELKRKWPLWNIDKNKGGQCRITAAMNMVCRAN
ncbi:MAG: hypothetical protein PHO91_02545 [Patescibacteria group bacterium]|nr:hypothetical protein [Patescibacteria group bacterium]